MEQLAIERKQWRKYFDSFNKRNHSRLVQLEVSDETGNHRTVKRMALSGVAFDKSGVEILLENPQFEKGSHYTHFIEKPKNVIKDLNLNGLDETLVIVDEAGFTTRLSFEHLTELKA